MKYKFVDSGKNTSGKGEITFGECPYCEHCRDLEPFTALIDDGGIEWCIGCWPEEIDAETRTLIETKEREAKIKYFKKRIKELKDLS
tara:strand:- start:31624 stop:31884 length:261 start_codon:yes stop_codon:yes gene_type:complete